jgi:hypothetical protein
VQRHQLLQEQPSKEPREHAHRQEEAHPARRCPAAFRAKYGQLHTITSVLSDFPVQHADLWGGM